MPELPPFHSTKLGENSSDFRAIIAFTINSTCAFFIKDRNQRIGAVQKVFDYKLFRDAEFLALSAWSVFSIGYVILSFSLPAYALSIGLTTQQGAIIGSILNLAQAVGRPCIGYFSDRAGRINMTAIASLACGLACLCIWIAARSFAVVVLFAIFSGLFVGNNWAVRLPITEHKTLCSTRIGNSTGFCRDVRNSTATFHSLHSLAPANFARHFC